MKRFLFYSLIIALPFICLAGVYMVLDPYKVLRSYNSYYTTSNRAMLGLNREHVSVETFFNNYSTYKYDSFILGNSRSICYRVEEWKEYIGDSASCFHFDASGESLFGLHSKVLFLREHSDIKNAIIVLDYSSLQMTDIRGGVPFIHSPKVCDSQGKLPYQLTFLKAFMNPSSIAALLEYTVTNKWRDYMENYLEKNEQERGRQYDVTTNELRNEGYDALIVNGEYYTEERVRVFDGKAHPNTVSSVVIGSVQTQMLADIKNVFVSENTDYRIVINPLFDQISLNPKDVEFLCNLFGADRVFDFSGTNSFTTDYHNYYEWSHYRPSVSKQIMEEIYK